MPDMELDRVDCKILAELQRDGRLSNQELADRISLSPSPCLRRVRRLEEQGYIKRYVALVDPERVGLGLLAYISIRLNKHIGSSHAPMADFARDVQAWPEVVECYAMTGDMDYLLRIQVADLAHFSRFAGLCILLGVVALLFYCTSMVSRARRRRGPRYQPPRELRGACSECGRDMLLQRYKQGWLCATCARRLRAHVA